MRVQFYTEIVYTSTSFIVHLIVILDAEIVWGRRVEY
jgi:hypothetical protein